VLGGRAPFVTDAIGEVQCGAGIDVHLGSLDRFVGRV
jgi:hypothetical protein